MLCYNTTDLQQLVDYNELVDCMEQAFELVENEECYVPERIHYHYGNNTLLSMSAFTRKYFATKLVSVNPQNADKNLPTIYGMVVLNCGETGKPLAIFNGAKLTALRTAAVGALGIRHFAGQNLKKIGVVGAGIQGLHQAIFACSQRNIQQVNVVDAYVENFNWFTKEFKNACPHVKLNFPRTTSELLMESEAVVLTTNTFVPALPNDGNLLSNKLFIGIGSYRPEMRELPDRAFNHVKQIVVDTETAVLESGDVIEPLRNGSITRDNVITMGQFLKTRHLLKAQSSVFYKSVGMAAFDLLAAILIYEKSLKQNIGSKVDIA